VQVGAQDVDPYVVGAWVDALLPRIPAGIAGDAHQQCTGSRSFTRGFAGCAGCSCICHCNADSAVRGAVLLLVLPNSVQHPSYCQHPPPELSHHGVEVTVPGCEVGSNTGSA
jgi:hypothetical protein